MAVAPTASGVQAAPVPPVPKISVIIPTDTGASDLRRCLESLTKQDLPIEVGVDLLFSNARVNVEGDDALGYRVSYGDATVTTESGQIPERMAPLLATLDGIVDRLGAK